VKPAQVGSGVVVTVVMMAVQHVAELQSSMLVPVAQTVASGRLLNPSGQVKATHVGRGVVVTVVAGVMVTVVAGVVVTVVPGVVVTIIAGVVVTVVATGGAAVVQGDDGASVGTGGAAVSQGLPITAGKATSKAKENMLLPPMAKSKRKATTKLKSGVSN